MSAGQHHRTIDHMGRQRGAGRRFHHHDEPRAGRRRGRFGPPDGMSFRGGTPFFGRGRTARRGEVRTAILTLLAEQPMHGYQVITELTERSGGDWRPSAGSVYPTLHQLADEGLVRDREVEARKVYELTDAGRQAIERSGTRTPPWERPDRDDAHELHHVLRGVISATMQVDRDADASMRTEARRILSETRRSLYRLLAEDSVGEEGDGLDA
jgi:DNA-binding PadR family transcriptional regulator